MNIELAPVAEQSAGQLAVMSVAEVRARVQRIQEVMRSIMLDGTHFGKIPGTDKPTLYKAGSELLLMTFRLAVDPEVLELSDGDHLRYRVRCRVLGPDGSFLGAGVGEASTAEEKYAWRRAVCQEEFDQTPETHRRVKWARGKGDGAQAYPTQQVRTNPHDQANTVLKMAKKRSQVDASLTVLGCSDIFNQDLEDMDEVPGAEQAPPQPRQQQPRPQNGTYRQPQRKPAGNTNGAAPPAAGNVISEAQAKRLYAIAKGAGRSDEDIKTHIRALYGIDHTRHLTRDCYDEVCAWAESGAPPASSRDEEEGPLG